MKELLTICGFEPEEIKKELPRIQKAFHKLDITPADTEVAKDRLKRYYQIDLKGFRMVLKIYIRELVNLMLAGEEKRKIIYMSLPAVVSWLTSSVPIVDSSVYGGLPELLLLMIYGGIFNKAAPIIEAAERDALVPEGAHCGCTQAKLGCRIMNLTPKPDLVLSWSIYCDESPKVDEYLREELGVPIVTVGRIMDTNFDETTLPQREVDYFAKEIRRARDEISKVIGVAVTDEAIWQVLMEAGMNAGTNEQILNLNLTSDPVPLADTTIQYLFSLGIIGLSRENLPLAKEALECILQETRQMVARNEGWYEKGAPRIATLAPSNVDPALSYLIKEVGLSVPVFEVIWYCPDSSLKPDLGSTDELDPCKIIAKAFSTVSLTAATHHRISAMTKAAREHKLDGFLGLTHYSCRPLVSDGFILKDAFKKNGNLPAAIVEADFYDSRFYTTEALRTRIESFAEMCKLHKIAKQINTSS